MLASMMLSSQNNRRLRIVVTVQFLLNLRIDEAVSDVAMLPLLDKYTLSRIECNQVHFATLVSLANTPE